ncbi:hypothetical protein F3Q52_21730 [Salmonella enterica subsp. enterica]|nr:hypothetical protein [Salmonella enterica subsp. enterica]ECW0361934.1 hypothetical protein [Salmonella enterica subsp. enterica]ECW0526836.1 hypothetical protein [Salmonella enterica subsp. enterica]ECW0962068.1 hypothetical protein [Salmonella enterica subsp. enterica]ECW0995194.1 hypothetical protein [Salmonella enterica subsp. enterica]
MKKLIIAAGIAAAAMASFGASAAHTYATDVSHASINTMINGDSVVIVTGTNGGSLSVEEAKVAGKTLGSFAIGLPVSAAGYGISNIHSHGYPDGFKVKFGTCAVAVSGAGGDIKNTLQPDTGYECVFDKTTLSLDVKTDEGNATADIQPGSKTITADFVAYTE